MNIEYVLVLDEFNLFCKASATYLQPEVSFRELKSFSPGTIPYLYGSSCHLKIACVKYALAYTSTHSVELSRRFMLSKKATIEYY